jgi:TRAP transporter TAXI family solute receptor
MYSICVAVAVAIALMSGTAAAQPANWPKSLTLGTSSGTAGVYPPYGAAWAKIASEAVKVPITPKATGGSAENAVLTDDRQIDLGMTTTGVALQAWNGVGDWTKSKKHRNIRAIFPMYDGPFYFLTTEKTGIRSVKQLAGKNVGLGSRGTSQAVYVPVMLEVLGIKANVQFAGSGGEARRRLAEGLTDVNPIGTGLPVPGSSEYEALRPVVFSFSEDEITTLLAKFPELSRSTIPAGTYKTLQENLSSVGLFNFAIAHKDLPDDLVYGIVKAVMENHARMVQAHSAAKETVPQNIAKNRFLPFHPGAVKYFRELGIRIPDNLIGG